MKHTIGRILRDARLALRLTIEYVAEMAGLDTGAVSKIETGNRNPRFETVVRICRSLYPDAEEELRALLWDLALSVQEPDPPEAVFANMTFDTCKETANTLITVGEPRRALPFCHAVVQFAETDDQKARAYSLLALAYKDLRRTGLAWIAFQNALRYFQLGGDPGKLGSRLTANLCHMWHEMGNSDLARTTLYGLLMDADLPMDVRSYTMHVLAIIWYDAGNNKEALRWARRAARLAGRLASANPSMGARVLYSQAYRCAAHARIGGGRARAIAIEGLGKIIEITRRGGKTPSREIHCLALCLLGEATDDARVLNRALHEARGEGLGALVHRIEACMKRLSRVAAALVPLLCCVACSLDSLAGF